MLCIYVFFLEYICIHVYAYIFFLEENSSLFIFLLIYLTSLPKVALFQLRLLTTGYNYSDNLQKANKVFSEMDQKVPHSHFSNISTKFLQDSHYY